MAGVFDPLPVWTIPPNWEGGVLERLEWLSDVLQSTTGAEQRRKMRLTPRRTFEISLTLQGAERTLYTRQVKAAGASDWYLPVWHDMVRLTAPLVVGATGIVPLVTDNHEYAAGGLVILYAGLFAYEIAVIDTVEADHLVLTAPIAATWPVGTRLMPVIRARLTAEPQANKVTDEVATVTVSFQGTRDNPYPVAADLPAYLGNPVLTVPPNYSENLTETWERFTTLLDNTTGRQNFVDTAGQGFAVRQYRWMLAGLAEHAALRSLLYTLAGRTRPIWIPTFSADLIPTKPIEDNILTVERCGYTDYPNAVTDIMVRTRAGYYFRSILSAAVAGDTEVLLLSAPTEDYSDIIQVCFLALSRQNSDTIEISHMTDAVGVAQVATTFREAPALRVTPSWDVWSTTDAYGANFAGQNSTLLRPWVASDGDGTLPDHMLVRAKHGHHTGKYYWEGIYTKLGGGVDGPGFGLATQAATWEGLSATGAGGVLVCVNNEGLRVLCNGVVILDEAHMVTIPNWADLFAVFAQVITFRFAVDLDAKRLYWSVPTGFLEPQYGGPDTSLGNSPWCLGAADPVAGTGGTDISSLGDVDLYPFAINQSEVGLSWHSNFGGETFTYNVPAGYNRGWSA